MRKITLPTEERNGLQWAIENGIINARPFVPQPNAINPVANHSGILKSTKDCKDWIEQFYIANGSKARNIKRETKYKGSVWNYLDEVVIRQFALDDSGTQVWFYLLTNKTNEIVGFYSCPIPPRGNLFIIPDVTLLRQAQTPVDATKFGYAIATQNVYDMLSDSPELEGCFSESGYDSLFSSFFEFNVCKAACIRKKGYIDDDFRTYHLPRSLNFFGDDLMESTFFPPKIATATNLEELVEFARQVCGTLVARGMPEFIHMGEFIEVDRSKPFSTIEEFAEMNGIELATF